MSRPLYPVLALAIAMVACERRPNDAEQRQLAGKVLKGTLAYPISTLVGISAGKDAAELTFSSPVAAAQVAEWFRRSEERRVGKECRL